MKKKIFSGFLAAAMVLSMSVSAFAANEVTDFGTDANVGGSGTVLAVSDIVDVIVPTNVNYAVNPAELSGKPQIMSGSFGIINHGSTAVKVDVTANIADSTTVTISDADTIAAINNATDAADVSEDALLYLAVAPVAKDTTVTAETVLGDDAYSKVAFDVVADVASGSAVAIPSGSPASMAFKLEAAKYDAKISGSAVTSGGGFEIDAEAVQEYKGDLTDDPVAAFTLVGSANKYADWTAVTLPEVTLTFNFSKLNTLAYDALEVDPATENMVVGDAGDVVPAVTAHIEMDADSLYLRPDASTPVVASKLSNVKCKGNTVAGNVVDGDGWICISPAQQTAAGVTGADATTTVTFTYDGVKYTATFDWDSNSQVFDTPAPSAPVTAHIEMDSDSLYLRPTVNTTVVASKLSNVTCKGKAVAGNVVDSDGWICISPAQQTAAGVIGSDATTTVTFTYDGVNYTATYTW